MEVSLPVAQVKISIVNTIYPGLATGEWKTLGELKIMALTDPDVQTMAKEDEEELIEALKEHRKAKKQNAQPNNKSAARDIIATMDCVTDEVQVHLLHYLHGGLISPLSLIAFLNAWGGVLLCSAAVVVSVMKQHPSFMCPVIL